MKGTGKFWLKLSMLTLVNVGRLLLMKKSRRSCY